MLIRRSNIFALAWGLAEATLFFIIPDVLLSWIALRSRRDALIACLWVAGGALLGGALMWLLGRNNPELIRQVLTFLPAITADMIAGVDTQLDDTGLTALFVGPFVGTPYKIYAIEAASLGFSLGVFLLISLPARLLRFVITSIVVGTLSHWLTPRYGARKLRIALLLFWIALYAVYFSVMPSKG